MSNTLNFTDHSKNNPDLDEKCDNRSVNISKMSSLAFASFTLITLVCITVMIGPYKFSEPPAVIGICCALIACISCVISLLTILYEDDKKKNAELSGGEYIPGDFYLVMGATPGSSVGMFEFSLVSFAVIVSIIGVMYAYKSGMAREGSTVRKMRDLNI